MGNGDGATPDNGIVHARPGWQQAAFPITVPLMPCREGQIEDVSAVKAVHLEKLRLRRFMSFALTVEIPWAETVYLITTGER